jgi:hypothetical protein
VTVEINFVPPVFCVVWVVFIVCMCIIGNIEDNIIVIYEIKSFYVTLEIENFSNNIHRENYHFTHSKN